MSKRRMRPGMPATADEKIAAIERTDAEVVSRLREYKDEPLRILVMPDHPTPIAIRTHVAEPVPFLMWGPGFAADEAARFTEAEAQKSGVLVPQGHNIMDRFTGGRKKCPAVKMNTAASAESRAEQRYAPDAAAPICLTTRCTSHGVATAASRASRRPATAPTANPHGGTVCAGGASLELEGNTLPPQHL